MRRSQRLLLIVALTLVSALLHYKLCEWRWNELASERSMIFGSEWEQTDSVLTQRFSRGLYAAENVPLADAITFGLATPLLLFSTAMYLALGWRGSSRAEHGRCPVCGYDLKADLDHGCPECGWRRNHD